MRPLSSRNCAIAYLSAIPVFAWLYTLFPYGFSQSSSTITEDWMLQIEAQQIAQDLTASIRRDFAAFYNGAVAEVRGRTVQADAIRVENVGSSNGTLNLVLYYSETALKPTLGPTGISMPIHMVLSTDSVGQVQADGTQAFSMVSKDIREPSAFFDVENLCPRRVGYVDGSYRITETRRGFVSLSPRLSERIGRFTDAHRGFASQSHGGFLRMLYLSAITITTVGFGDIVPVSLTTRLLVAFEAVFGVVLVGLFLNALSREHQNAKPIA